MLTLSPIPLVGDEGFSRRHHHSLPIIRVAGVPEPSSDPIVIESEPIMLSPAGSGSGHSQSPSSPPRSPPEPRRIDSVSSNSNSDPGARLSSTFTPPQSTGIRTPPNSWAPQFQEPRPPPGSRASSHATEAPIAMPDATQYHHPSRQPIVMPAPTQYRYVPYSNHATSSIIVPSQPSQGPARGASPTGSWSPQEVREYRASVSSLSTSPNQDYRQANSSLAPSQSPGFGIRNSIGSPPSISEFAPYSPDFQAQLQDPSVPQYVYTPSTARRGQAGKHRSQSWLESRASDGTTGPAPDGSGGQQRYVIRNI